MSQALGWVTAMGGSPALLDPLVATQPPPGLQHLPGGGGWRLRAGVGICLLRGETLHRGCLQCTVGSDALPLLWTGIPCLPAAGEVGAGKTLGLNVGRKKKK